MAARLGAAVLFMALAADALELDSASDMALLSRMYSKLDQKYKEEAQQEMARMEAKWAVQVNDFKDKQMNLIAKEADTEQDFLHAKLERAHSETLEAKAEQRRAYSAMKEAETVFQEKKLRAEKALALADALEREATAAFAAKKAHKQTEAAIAKRDEVTQERIQAQKDFEAKRERATELRKEADLAKAAADAQALKQEDEAALAMSEDATRRWQRDVASVSASSEDLQMQQEVATLVMNSLASATKAKELALAVAPSSLKDLEFADSHHHSHSWS